MEQERCAGPSYTVANKAPIHAARTHSSPRLSVSKRLPSRGSAYGLTAAVQPTSRSCKKPPFRTAGQHCIRHCIPSNPNVYQDCRHGQEERGGRSCAPALTYLVGAGVELANHPSVNRAFPPGAFSFPPVRESQRELRSRTATSCETRLIAQAR